MTEAERLAKILDNIEDYRVTMQAATLLRKLQAENEALRKSAQDFHDKYHFTVTEREALRVDAERFKRLQEMEASLCDPEKICYYINNFKELDQLVKDWPAKQGEPRDPA